VANISALQQLTVGEIETIHQIYSIEEYVSSFILAQL